VALSKYGSTPKADKNSLGFDLDHKNLHSGFIFSNLSLTFKYASITLLKPPNF
jgi:hypothetical protein